ncbi:MAG TPA: aminotransferase class I/II-fold pyridoxal phosphate-dependent enzyme [Bryobacterales bacterium]|nr:aminotransferase class I/II-fold pyridoxal phosphate-dependent enzyme [Bryobacterales bacterium]
MKLEPFEMERWQSEWENRVEYNLSESSVYPLTLRELLDSDPLEPFLDMPLGYSQTNGTPELRERIAALYPGATVDSVLVTNGAAEANFLAIWHLIEPGDEIVLMLPNYMQIWGLARALGASVVPFHLREDCHWAPDLAELARAVSARTKLIAVCNPNNPTGAILREAEMQAIVEAARRAGAWLLADEVYQGAERDSPPTPSFWGLYDKVLITNGLSKSYGLPGLRVGWLVAPRELIARLWAGHDYTTITIGPVSDSLACLALTPPHRRRIWDRTRRILRENYPLLEQWIAANPGLFRLIPPAAGAIAYLQYSREINSTELARKLRDEQSVLVVPGDHFGMDHYLRINYGPPPGCLEAGLQRIQETMRALRR